MRRTLAQRIGTGVAWLDGEEDGRIFACSWRADDSASEIFESERVRDVAGAVAWGRARTPCVVIRIDDQTLWAGDCRATVPIDGEWDDLSSKASDDAS